jgi:FkbM family methyltransferase
VLDIGAWSAADKSNSRALIEKGWEAVLVEFAPGPLRKLVYNYGPEGRRQTCVDDIQVSEVGSQAITIVGAAFALEPGLIEMHITDDAVSTNSLENYDVWKERGNYIGKLWVPTVTMEDIFNRFGEGGFDFVSIDTEGSSVDIALAFLKTEMFPKCYCIEHDKKTHDLLSVALNRGYQARYLNDTNIVLALP